MSRLRIVLLAVVAGLASASAATAQVAFAPQVSSFPNGVTLGVTPVVSADRRYVRMTLNPQFTGLQGFDTYSVPAAVSGGGGMGGAGGLGALGGLGGGRGFRSVAIPGPTFAAGMDGLIAGDSGPDPSRFLSPAWNGYSSFDGFPERRRIAAGLPGAVRPKAQSSRRKTAASKTKRPIAAVSPAR